MLNNLIMVITENSSKNVWILLIYRKRPKVWIFLFWFLESLRHIFICHFCKNYIRFNFFAIICLQRSKKFWITYYAFSWIYIPFRLFSYIKEAWKILYYVFKVSSSFLFFIFKSNDNQKFIFETRKITFVYRNVKYK